MPTVIQSSSSSEFWWHALPPNKQIVPVAQIDIYLMQFQLKL